MLPCASLGNDAALAHAPGQQSLPKAVVDLVGTRVVEILALEPDLCATEHLGPASRVINRRGTSHKMLELVVKLGQKLGIVAVTLVREPQLLDGLHQGFCNEHATVRTKMPLGIGKVVGFQEKSPQESSGKTQYPR